METELPKMFRRAPNRGDTLSGGFVEDILAAGFDVYPLRLGFRVTH